MNTQDNSTLRRRFENRLPGRELVTIIDAALPVTPVNVEILGQERKDLPLTEEFLLRLLDAGVNDLDEMSEFLGISRDLIEDAAVEQHSAGNVSYRSETQKLALTIRGRSVALEHMAIRPVEVSLPLAFDRLLWQATDYPRNALMFRNEALDEGLLLLPADRSARVVLADVPVRAINDILRTRSTEVLAVRKVVSQIPKYLPVKLLVFADAPREEVQTVVCIDGDLSPAHDAVLAQMGGAEMLDIHLTTERVAPEVDPHVLELIATAQASDQVPTANPPTEGLEPEPATPLASPVDHADLVERIPMYEHADVLQGALRTSQRRLLILSPWVQGSVVNTTFLGLLESRLRAKVKVHIAFGYSGPKGQENDERALQKLRNMCARYPDHFSLVRLRNSHAKVLIADNAMVTTSFNWLSFKGSRDMDFRIEEGLRVKIPSVVDESYDYYLKLLKDEAVSDPA
jgi:hypothetical protein